MFSVRHGPPLCHNCNNYEPDTALLSTEAQSTANAKNAGNNKNLYTAWCYRSTQDDRVQTWLPSKAKAINSCFNL